MKRTFIAFLLVVLAGCGSQVTVNHLDYSRQELWYQLAEPSFDADVFYILPTCVHQGDPALGEDSHFADLSNPDNIKGMDFSHALAKSVFGAGANFYSPYYRQVDLESWGEGEDVVQRRTERALVDVYDAFDYYYGNLRGDRPFVLAGFSQGALAVKELYKRMSDEQRRNMVAAYVMGFSVTADDVAACPAIRAAQDSSDTGCFICYNTVGEGTRAEGFFGSSVMCINPTNWRTDQTPGYLPGIDASVAVNTEANVLEVSGLDLDEYFIEDLGDLFPRGVLHLQEIYFYEDCLRSNVITRIKSFMTPATLTYEPFEGSLRHSFTIATYSRSSTPIVHTKLEWRGITAYGEAAMPQYLGETTEGCSAFLDRVSQEVLPAVQDPTDIDAVMAAVDALAPGNKAAKASVDIALHDLLGKVEGQPLWEMWGIDSSATPYTSFTIGYDDSDEVVFEKVAEASWAKILKVKLGMGAEKDKRMIDLVRSASDVPIYVDANQGWKTKEEALEMIEWLAERGVVLVEQPMAKELVDEHKWITEHSKLPIIADEACQRLEDVEKLQGVYDGINIKLMKCTGLDEARKMIAKARELGMQVMLGCMTETSVGISAAAQISPLVDYADLDGNVLLSNDNFKGVGLSDGRLVLNGLPGIGAVPVE